MLRGTRKGLLCALVTIPSSPAAHISTALTVLVYNDARLPAANVYQAEREATRIYNRAGIETVWVDCPPTPSEVALYPACRVPITATTLVIHIASQTMAERWGLPNATLGTALFPEDGSFGLVAIVCGDRATLLARPAGSRRIGLLLGALFAHEVGHLLLGPGSHSRSGIMHTPWTRRELSAITLAFEFDRSQAKHLRKQVMYRVRSRSPVNAEPQLALAAHTGRSSREEQ